MLLLLMSRYARLCGISMDLNMARFLSSDLREASLEC